MIFFPVKKVMELCLPEQYCYRQVITGGDRDSNSQPSVLDL